MRYKWVDGSSFYTARFYPTSAQIVSVVGGTVSYLATVSLTSATGTWYDVYVRSNGSNITVYRRATGSGSEFAQVLTTASAPTLATSASFTIFQNQWGRYSLDNIRIVSDNVSTSTTYAYDQDNELTKTTTGGVDTLYTYDAWGRNVTKSMQSGAHQAIYQYRYGDRLKRIDSTFPDDAALVQYVTDGLGRLREKVVNGSAYSWYRWTGSSIGVEYADQNMLTRALTYVGGAEIAGTQSSTGAYRYYYGDHLGSVRRMRSNFDRAP